MKTIIALGLGLALIAPAFAFAQEGACSSPTAVGWNVSLPNGGCDVPAVVATPGISIQNADGSWTLHAANAVLIGVDTWHLN